MALALLSGISIVEDTERAGAWLLLGSALLFGLPHGAADFWLLKERAYSADRSFTRFGVLLFLYTLAALLIAVFWFYFPDLSIVAFLLLTALHFGAGDEVWQGTDSANPVPSLLRGTVVIVAPLAFHPVESGAVLTALAPSSNSLPLVGATLAWAPSLLIASAAVLAVFDVMSWRSRRPYPTVKWLELGLLTLFFWILTPLFAVAVYFVVVHSWRHVFRLELYEKNTDSEEFSEPVLKVIRDFYVKALPVTLLSLIGLAVIYIVFRPDPGTLTAWTSSYLILLSALTVPHAILIGLTEKRLAAA